MNLFKKNTRKPLFNKHRIADQVASEVLTTLCLTVGTAAFVGLLEGGKALAGKAQASLAARKLAKLQAAEESGAAEEVVQEFNENSGRDAMVAFLKENGVVNAHSMKEATLLEKVQEVKRAQKEQVETAPVPA